MCVCACKRCTIIDKWFDKLSERARMVGAKVLHYPLAFQDWILLNQFLAIFVNCENVINCYDISD